MRSPVTVLSVLPLVAASLTACAGPGPAAPAPRVAFAAPPPLVASELPDDAAVARAISEHYVKYEQEIAMRDGVKLFTAFYVPRDQTRTYPILLHRTPYSVRPYGVDAYPPASDFRALRRFAPSPRFVREGYIFVHQDVRGRMMSGGDFVDVRPGKSGNGAKDVDESTDAYDTIDWLVKHVPANNGRVGVWGISYPGFYAAQSAVGAHPALKAVSPQAPVTDWFRGDDFHHNGALFLADAFGFYASFGKPRPKPTKQSKWGFDYDAGDLYEFFLSMGPVSNANEKYFKGEIAFWNDLVEHGALDAFWQARDPRPRYKGIKPAVMTVGGWFDAEDLWGALETYRAIEKQSPGAENVLVMGPWSHGGWSRTEGDRLGDVTFHARTSDFYRDRIEFPFFQRHLSGRGGAPPPEAWIFETGTNVWASYDAWPPRDAKPRTLYFGAGGALLDREPAAAADAVDTWVSDPSKPVPYHPTPSLEVLKDFMTADQRFASRRPDVVTYQTEPLEADLRIAGPIEASLWVSVTGTDADFVVKVVDVYPHDYPEPEGKGAPRMAGYQQLVRAEVLRGKFRESLSSPKPFTPGEPTLVKITLPDAAHAFRRGHRMMIQVQSSWFPLVDRNPQTFCDIYAAKETDFKVAKHTLHRAPGRASSVRVLTR
jgi:uncharacterized protein